MMASSRAAAVSASTSGRGTWALGATPTDPANSAQDQRPARMPSGIPTMRAADGQGGCLPAHHCQQLRLAHANDLEDGQVAAAAAHPGDQHVGQRGDAEQGEQGAEDERRIADPGVVLDVERPLVACYRA